MQSRDIPAVKSSFLGEDSEYKKAARAAADESFFEMTGNKGDVILMHPLMLHSASNNAKRAIRESFSRQKHLGALHKNLRTKTLPILKTLTLLYS